MYKMLVNYNLNLLIELFATTLEVIIIFAFFGNTFEKRFKKSFLYLLAEFAIILLVISFDIINLFINYKAFIIVIVFILAATLLYKGRFVNKLLVNILVFTFLFIADIVAYSIENILIISETITTILPIYERLFMIFVSKTLFFMLIKLCSKRNISLYNNIKLTALYYFLVTILPLITISTFFTLFYCLQFIPEAINIFSVVLTLSLCMLFFNIFVFNVFEALLKGVQSQNDAYLMHQQYELQVKHFENIEKHQENLRSIKHDINNHFFCIRSYLEKGCIEDAINYIFNIDNRLTQTDIFSNSGNIVIDALLNNRFEIFRSEGIKINTTVRIPKKLKIRNDDLCIVLSNVLDNAIDACKNNKSGEKFIDLSIEYKKELLFIDIKNNFEDEPIELNGEFITIKENSKFHGIGLKNVKSTVEKYNGYVNININDKIFTLNIFMCDIKL